MSSNITLFKNGNIAVPEYLQQVDETTRMLAGSGGKAISIKGGVWRMIVGTEEVARNEERAMNMIIVGASQHVQRTFYEGQYVEGQTSSSDCWSADGITPNVEVPAETRQSTKCADCRQNIAGSGQNNSRACRYSRRLAVVLENDIEGNVYRLQLPAKSIFGKATGDKMPLDAYAKFLAGHNVPITGVVTEAKFDTSEAVPVIQFRAVRPLDREEWDQVQLQAQSPDALNAVELKVTPQAAKPEPAQQNSDYQEAPAPAPAAPPVAAAPAARKTAPRKPAEAPAPAPAPVAAAPVPEPSLRPAKAPATAPGAEPSDSGNARVNAVLSDWLDDDDA